MGKYTIIADTGERLVELLQRELVPEVIKNPDEIGLRSPEEHGDVSLGIYLYDIRESDEVRLVRPAVMQNEKLVKPPILLNLFYMITAYSGSDVKYRMSQEERILGKVIQTFHDNPLLSLQSVDEKQTFGSDLHIQMLRMELDEKARIWSFPNVGNKLSLFYRVSPVAIDSNWSADIRRVTDVGIHVSDMTI